MATRGVVEIPFFADFAQLIQQSERAGVSIEAFSGRVVTSARQAARAMADYAKAQGASADEAEAAAARTAAAWDATYGAMSKGAKDAGNAALSASRLYKASADEQTVAFSKAAAAQKDLEAQQKAASDAAKATAAKTAAAAEESSARVAAAHKKLASIGKWSLFGGAAVVAESVKGAADLSQSMARLQTQAGASHQQVAKLTQGVLGMAGTVGDSPNELAQGLYHVVSNLNKTLAPAQRVTDELGALKVAAEGARVGGSDLVDTTNALGAAIRSGISGTQNYQQAMGALNATVGAGDMTMQQLSEALGTGLLGPMKNYGVSLKDISAALAVFGDNNIRGADAGTKLASAIRIMAAPSKTAGEALRAVGMTSLQMADDIRSRGLLAALQDLKTHLKDSGATASQQALIIERAFGGRQSTGVQLLLGQLGTLKAAEKEVGDGANKFGGAWKVQNHQLSQEFADLKATVQSLADRFGYALIPVLKTTATDVGDVIVWFEKNKTAAEALGATIAGVLGVAVTVFIGSKVVAFVKGVQAMGSATSKLASTLASNASKIEDKLVGISSASTDTAAKVEASNTATEASNAEVGASFTGVATKAGAAGTALEGEWAATGTEIESTNATIEGSNATMGASFAAPASEASKLLGVMMKLADIGTIVITIDVVEKGISQILNTLNSRNGLQAMLPTSTAAKGLLGMNAQGGRMTRSQFLKLQGGSNNGGSSVTSDSAPWKILGISKAHWDKMSPSTRAYLSGSSGTTTASTSTPGSSSWAAKVRASEAAGGRASVIQWAKDAQLAAAKYGVNPALLLADISQESGGTAVHSTGSTPGMGNLTQFLPSTGAEYGVKFGTTSADELSQIMGQAKYLSALGVNKNAFAALEGYNSGTVGDSVSAGYASSVLGMEKEYAPLFTGKLGTIPIAGASPSTPSSVSKTLQDYLNGVSPTSAASKARTITGRRSTSSGSISTTITDDVTRYQHLASSAASDTIKKLYLSIANEIEGLGPKFEAEAKSASTSAQESQIKDALKVALTGITTGLAANVKTLTLQHTTSTSVGNTITRAVQHYQELQQTAANAAAKTMYGSTIKDVRHAGKRFEHRAGHVTSSAGRTKLTNELAQLLQAIGAHAQEFAKASTMSTSLIKRYSDVTQSGTSRTLQSALGASTSGPGPFHEYLPEHGVGRSYTPSIASLLHGEIESMRPNASIGRIGRSLGGTLNSAAAGSMQGAAFRTTVENLIQSGQEKEATKLVAAHKAAMTTLAVTLYAEQKTKDGKELDAQATALKDQTTAIQNAMQDAQTLWQASEQKINDMAAGTVQAMQDTQQKVNDTMSGIAQQIKDMTAIQTDQSTAVVDAINDQTQIQVDQIGEKGLYGLNLIAQQEKVAADQVKAYWDQQIAAAQKQLDIDQQQADAAENAAQIALDQVTATEHVAVQNALIHVDTVAVTQASRVAAAQAHADAVQLSADTTKIGPAQIAVDLNANASKSVQAKFQAQLVDAQGQADKQTAVALKHLADVQTSAQTANDTAHAAYDQTNNTANQMIQGAQDTLSNITNYWNNVIAGAQQNLAGIQGNANIAEATANRNVSVTSAEASTQFAGSGLVINQYGVDLSNPSAVQESTSWGVRASGIATP